MMNLNIRGYDNNDEGMVVLATYPERIKEEMERIVGPTPLIAVSGELLRIPAASGVDEDGTPTVYINNNVLRYVSEEENFLYLLEVLVHEMCHIKQIESGRLDTSSVQDTIIFEGAQYPIEEVDPQKVEYIYLPWEYEAHLAGLEYVLKQGAINSIQEGWARIIRAYGETFGSFLEDDLHIEDSEVSEDVRRLAG